MAPEPAPTTFPVTQQPSKISIRPFTLLLFEPAAKSPLVVTQAPFVNTATKLVSAASPHVSEAAVTVAPSKTASPFFRLRPAPTLSLPPVMRVCPAWRLQLLSVVIVWFVA